ncbi:carbohydrate ABC transporter permease [Candidatus Sordicultor fermentans]|uniref:carbohydrate ABC transporter permease n=1 Tax=Candidatus Sordicultor fermentans TaxID=1953203 RepID=UPI001694518A|nr:carbohydrate ABC transporter permease [Atribacterota bacterium]NLY05170.1 carbohydrate ABC transporter permease [Candidatus Atribacteria bacterium]HOA98931.1 carbohydrate ABC transporter permease [Candidatus Atribacteria bacterium]HPZ40246.1 carbohydrate ABC transporter permease [Candidatus Atribacteria bacterium]
MNVRARALTIKFFQYLVMVVVAIIMFFPILWIIASSFKPLIEFNSYPPSLFPSHLYFKNYTELFLQSKIFIYLRNTLILIIGNTLGTLLSSSIVAYPLARMEFKGRDLIFGIILATMMVPSFVTIIPQYLLFREFRWLDTFLPMIVPAFFAYPYNVFLFRQFYRTIPRELDEAAKIDGCNSWQIFWRIIVPLSRPIFITIGVLSSIFWWNEFFTPLIFIDSENLKPLSVGSYSFSRTMFIVRWDLLMAMSTIMIVPPMILYLFTRRYIMEGIKTTGIK